MQATSTTAEKTSALVATFACQLMTPGTSTISYDIVVENKGSLNAVLNHITLNANASNDIGYYVNKDKNNPDS